MEWHIKRFSELTADEIYDILELRSKVFVLEQNCPYQDVDGADKRSYQLFGCEPDGTLAGCLRILDKGQTFEETAIGRVAVEESLRGRGYARQMMERALEFAAHTLGEQVISISAQVYLVDFYKSLGFTAVSESYLEDGIPHLDMKWKGPQDIQAEPLLTQL